MNLVVLSIGAFADLAFYEEVKQAAREGGAKVHLASGAIGGFDVLQTVTLMAEALNGRSAVNQFLHLLPFLRRHNGLVAALDHFPLVTGNNVCLLYTSCHSRQSGC